MYSAFILNFQGVLVFVCLFVFIFHLHKHIVIFEFTNMLTINIETNILFPH